MAHRFAPRLMDKQGKGRKKEGGAAHSRAMVLVCGGRLGNRVPISRDIVTFIIIKIRIFNPCGISVTRCVSPCAASLFCKFFLTYL